MEEQTHRLMEQDSRNTSKHIQLIFVKGARAIQNGKGRFLEK